MDAGSVPIILFLEKLQILGSHLNVLAAVIV